VPGLNPGLDNGAASAYVPTARWIASAHSAFRKYLLNALPLLI
jgi:hypothetical protein